jgi:nucleoid DNA-binding protein
MSQMTIDQIGQYLKENVEGLTKKQGEEAYKALVELVKEEANKEMNTVVALPKLGKITIKHKGEYQGKNPRTQEPMTIAPMRKATFAAYDSFKESLNSVL